MTDREQIIHIDRTELFDPASFIGEGWSIEKQDERSLALTEIYLAKVRLVTMLNDDETSIKEEKKLARLKSADYIRLDAKVFQTFWQNQNLIPEQWKEKINGNTAFIFFDGTDLRSPGGDRYAICLCWFGGPWYWFYYRLDNDRGANDLSVVLASN